MRVLVTGGLGYVGRAVAVELTRAGHEVTVLTHAARPRVGPPAGATLARGDLRDGSAVTDLVAVGGYQGVCHLAALTQVRESFEQPVRYHEVNVSGTVALLRAFEDETERTGEPARVVFASTAAVYGAVDGERIGEDHPTRPTSPYGASKLAAENLLTHQAATGRIGAISLRTFNAAGAVDGVGDTDLTRVIRRRSRSPRGSSRPSRSTATARRSESSRTSPTWRPPAALRWTR